MVERVARDKVADALEEYLDERITAFQFDELLGNIVEKTKDETLHSLRLQLWFHYDDLIDHKVVATKAEWDFFQRLLLLLRSDGCLEFTNARKWTVRNAIATGALACFLCVAVATGWGWHLAINAIPFGIVSVFLDKWRCEEGKADEDLVTFLYPFSSLTDILRARRHAPFFAKRRYPEVLRTRRIRSAIWETDISKPIIVLLCLVLSPLALLVQTLPEDRSTVRVVVE